ncbi:hypothetical protein A2U01_0103893, partial [Trifolium medium]|nr:hypothetical protein [Trifolium medium]
MKRLDEEEEPRCYCVDVIEVRKDKCKVQPPNPQVERKKVDMSDAQEAEWEHEI